MQFCYVLSGWEGIAHNGRVLAYAFDKDFKIPERKYYLGDAGYGLSKQVLVPFTVWHETTEVQVGNYL